MLRETSDEFDRIIDSEGRAGIVESQLIFRKEAGLCFCFAKAIESYLVRPLPLHGNFNTYHLCRKRDSPHSDFQGEKLGGHSLFPLA